MKRDKLVVFWSKREKDFLIRYPRSCDGHFAAYLFTAERPRGHGATLTFDKSAIADLEERGYDTKTLRFSVERRKAAGGPEHG